MTIVKVTIAKGEKKWVAYFNEKGLMESLSESNLFTDEHTDTVTGKTNILDRIKEKLNDNTGD